MYAENPHNKGQNLDDGVHDNSDYTYDDYYHDDERKEIEYFGESLKFDLTSSRVIYLASTRPPLYCRSATPLHFY